MRLHLQEQISLYGEQSLVSLVNHKGHEQPVKEAFEKYIAEVSANTCSPVDLEFMITRSTYRKLNMNILTFTMNASICAGTA